MPRRSIVLGLGVGCLSAGWVYVLFRFPQFFIFASVIPLVVGIQFSGNKNIRNAFITCFVILWTLVFHYESLRIFYLQPFFDKPLPKTKFLFPPAGWIMFYNVGNSSGNIEVYGIKGYRSQMIDPHDIFRTRTIGFDNFHRGIMGVAANQRTAKDFCRYLRYRLPYFDDFFVKYVGYPRMTTEPYARMEQILYSCGSQVVL